MIKQISVKKTSFLLLPKFGQCLKLISTVSCMRCLGHRTSLPACPKIKCPCLLTFHLVYTSFMLILYGFALRKGTVHKIYFLEMLNSRKKTKIKVFLQQYLTSSGDLLRNLYCLSTNLLI